VKRIKKPTDVGEEPAELAEIAGDMDQAGPAAVPQVVAMRLLKFAQSNLRDMIGDAPEQQFEHKTFHLSRLRQLAGKLTFAIDLLEGKRLLTEETEVPT
jgi:hypothetical protein